MLSQQQEVGARLDRLQRLGDGLDLDLDRDAGNCSRTAGTPPTTEPAASLWLSLTIATS